MESDEYTKIKHLLTDHPVVPVIAAKEDLKTNVKLQKFTLSKHAAGEVPYTLSEFCHGYLQFLIDDFLEEVKEMPYVAELREGIDANIEKLSWFAFNSLVLRQPATNMMLYQVFSPEISGYDHIPFECYGLLRRDLSYRDEVRFRERWVFEYLVARVQCQMILHKLLKKDKSRQIDAYLRQSLENLITTRDIWVMTLGCLAWHEEVHAELPQLLTEIIREGRYVASLMPYELTQLGIECIYEAQSASDADWNLDDFMINQSVNLSALQVAPSRKPYILSSLGYIVRKNGDIYGLNLTAFGVNETNVSFLVDPTNLVSDNCLQMLKLSHNPLRALGMRKLQRFLAKASCLSVVDLTCCELGDKGVSVFANLCMCMPLQSLNLSRNEIHDQGMEVLTDNLKYCPTLESLDLSNNYLTDKSANLLGYCMKVLPEMRFLNLKKNRFSKSGAQYIKKNFGTHEPGTPTKLHGLAGRVDVRYSTGSEGDSGFMTPTHSEGPSCSTPKSEGSVPKLPLESPDAKTPGSQEERRRRSVITGAREKRLRQIRASWRRLSEPVMSPNFMEESLV